MPNDCHLAIGEARSAPVAGPMAAGCFEAVPTSVLVAVPTVVLASRSLSSDRSELPKEPPAPPVLVTGNRRAGFGVRAGWDRCRCECGRRMGE